jgi:hypothetical protein
MEELAEAVGVLLLMIRDNSYLEQGQPEHRGKEMLAVVDILT